MTRWFGNCLTQITVQTEKRKVRFCFPVGLGSVTLVNINKHNRHRYHIISRTILLCVCYAEKGSHKRTMHVKQELLKGKEQRSQQWNEKIWRRYGVQKVHEVWVRAKDQPSTMERPCRLKLYSKCNLVWLSISKDSQLGLSEYFGLVHTENTKIALNTQNAVCMFILLCLHVQYLCMGICVCE